MKKLYDCESHEKETLYVECPKCKAALDANDTTKAYICPHCATPLKVRAKKRYVKEVEVEEEELAEEVKTETQVETLAVEEIAASEVLEIPVPVLETRSLQGERTKRKKKIFLGIKWFFLILLSIFFCFPIYTLLINSVMPDEQLLGVRSLWPDYFYFGAYGKMFNAEYLNYLKNTLVVCALNVGGVCIASSLCAYGLSKVKFKGKNLIFMIIMATVLLPGTVTSIPLFIIYTELNWTGTLLPLWLPIWFGGGAMNIFLVRQFMKGIPNSYSEAAILDGAGSFQIYYMIILPLIKPIIAYLAVTTFFGAWNDFTGPLMYVADVKESWTLSLALYKDFSVKQSTTNNNLANAQMAVGVLMMIPCVVLFAFFQQEIMEGIATIGLKG